MGIVNDIKNHERSDALVEIDVTSDEVRHEDDGFQEFDLTGEMVQNILRAISGDGSLEDGVTISMLDIPGTDVTKVKMRVR